MSRRFSGVLALALLGALFLVACGGSDDGPASQTSSRSYKGHSSYADSNNLVTVYPATRGTRLDDCHTCHRNGTITDSSNKTTEVNPCSFCHAYAITNPRPTGAPTSYADTLNAFGKEYLEKGKSVKALRAMASSDSDSDGYSNSDEIAALRYPGDAESFPGQQVAPIVTLTESQIKALPTVNEFILMNANKQEQDEYAVYKGPKLKDVLIAAGVDLNGATGVTLFAPDGFTTTYTMADLESAMPQGTFYAGLEEGGATLGDAGFVVYPEQSLWPQGLTDHSAIPGESWVLLAYEHNGTGLDDGYLDRVSGKIGGEGPFRGIIPQKTPGRPDRGRNVTPVGDDWDYDDSADHNAGSCPKVTVAIRVEPMPEGLEEFDWKNGGWSFVSEKTLIIYGHGVTAKTR